MKNWVRWRGISYLLLVLTAWQAHAQQETAIYGGGEIGPFPLTCTSFIGEWESANGRTITIGQNGCRALVMNLVDAKGHSEVVKVSPDGRVRVINSGGGGDYVWGSELYRWDSAKNASKLISEKVFTYSDRVVHVHAFLERVGIDSMRETQTERVIYKTPGRDNREVFRSTDFRRVSF